MQHLSECLRERPAFFGMSGLSFSSPVCPNFILTVVLMAFAVYWAWARGFSPVELISRRADRGLLAILRRRLPRPGVPLLESFGDRDGDWGRRFCSSRIDLS